MVNSDDVEWAVRCQKRIAAVRRIRSEYGHGGPPPPDAEDRGLSKRAWEKLFLEWRLKASEKKNVDGKKRGDGRKAREMYEKLG